MVLTNEPPVREVTPTPPPRRRTSRLGDRGLAALFISPAMLLLLAMSVFPLLWALTLSFTNYSATSSAPAEFVGFANYAEILTSPAVRQRALTTLVYVVGAVTLQTVLGFGIAYLISRRERGRGLLTTVFLVPMMLSPIDVVLTSLFMIAAKFNIIYR